LTQQLATGAALHRRLFALADYNSLDDIFTVEACVNELFAQRLTTSFGAENGFGFDATHDEQADVATLRIVTVSGQKVIGILTDSRHFRTPVSYE
jgi:hypothetical protein